MNLFCNLAQTLSWNVKNGMWDGMIYPILTICIWCIYIYGTICICYMYIYIYNYNYNYISIGDSTWLFVRNSAVTTGSAQGRQHETPGDLRREVRRLETPGCRALRSQGVRGAMSFLWSFDDHVHPFYGLWLWEFNGDTFFYSLHPVYPPLCWYLWAREIALQERRDSRNTDSITVLLQKRSQVDAYGGGEDSMLASSKWSMTTSSPEQVWPWQAMSKKWTPKSTTSETNQQKMTSQ